MKNYLIRFLYKVAKNIYWKLPSPLRNKLVGEAHSVVRQLRSLGGGNYKKVSCVDISWHLFNETVLSKKDDTKKIIVFERNIDWDIPLFQRPQHLSVALGNLGHIVIYMTTGDGVKGFRNVATNVWLSNDESVALIPHAYHIFLSTSLMASSRTIEKVKKSGYVIYDYVDHIDPLISGSQREILRLLDMKKKAFSGCADYVITTAKQLYMEAITHVDSSICSYIPNGVDVEHYRKAINTDCVLPDNLVAFRSKYSITVGYFGAMAPWLWYELIDLISSKMPDFGFIFIGPDYQGGLEKLPLKDNIIYCGAVEYNNLPSYAKLFDISFIPFEPSEIASSTSPLKLFEYFALGKPVVVTECMNECTVYEEVFSGSDALSFIKAIKLASQSIGDSAYISKLRELAEKNSWSVRAEQFDRDILS